MKGSLWAVDPAFRPSLIESIRRASLLSNPHFDIPVDVTEKSLTKMRSTTTVVTPSVDSKETDAIESMLRLTKHCIPCLSPTPEEEVKFVRQQECLKRKSNPDIVLHLKGDPGKEHNYSNNKKVVGTQADVLKVVNNPIVFNPILTTCDHSSQGFLAQVDYESMKGAEVLFSLLTKNRSRLSSNDQQFSSSKKFKSEPKH